jgi:hypothetical protein
MRLYAVRHKATQQLMPLMKRGRGYSSWNPATAVEGERQVYASTDIPRLLSSERAAAKVIAAWARNPNCHYWRTHDDEEMIVKQDGRQASDLEVVPMLMLEREP